jgi:ABC-type Mn2+/Zn2+ transport system ATPase subunit
LPVSLVVASNLSAGYGGPAVLDDVTFRLDEGERIAVLGPNGGGKSTLFRTLLGELSPVRGSIQAPKRLGYLPQTERSRLDYPVSALDVVLMGTLSRFPWWKPLPRRERQAGLDALERVGLRGLAGASFGRLSGGQRQRTLLARALVQDGAAFLLDEPFSGVDQPSAELMERLFEELVRERRGLLIATHDVEQARISDHVLCLNRRQVAFGPPDETLTTDVLEKTYGAAIIALPAAEGEARAIVPPHHH